MLTCGRVRWAVSQKPKLIFFFFMDRGEFEVDENTHIKYESKYPAISTEQSWSIKDLLYAQENVFTRDESGKSRSAKMGPPFPSGSNQNTGIASL